MRLLSYEALRDRGIPYSKVHLWRLIKNGDFPKPIKLGASRNAWVEHEINDWIAQKISDRDQ